jgi:type II secretory pathway predicted ATPase ExeA
MAAEPTPDNRETPGPFQGTAVALEALQKLEPGLGARKPLVLLLGEPGTGKSTVAGEVVRRWGARVTPVRLSARGLEAQALAGALLARFGGKPKPGASPIAAQERLIETLANATSGGRVAVLVVDDAHELDDDSVLELARLADRAGQRQCPLEVLLVGEPSLAGRFESPDLAGASEDVSVRVTLEPFTAHDTRHYLLQRPGADTSEVRFSRKACRDIHAVTRGIARDVEALASRSAGLAQAWGGDTVSPEHVRVAWQAMSPAHPRERKVEVEAKVETQRPSPEREREAPAAAAPVAAAAPKREAAAPIAPASSKREAPAPVEPQPTPAEDAARPVAAESAAEAKSSSDPRVKDWVSRFGGSGVSIGGQYVPRNRRELEDFSDRPSPGATGPGATLGAGAVPPAQVTDTSDWVPLKLVPGRHHGTPRQKNPAFAWQMSTLALGLALVAVVIGQRRMGPTKPAEVAPATSPSSVATPVTPEPETIIVRRPAPVAATPRAGEPVATRTPSGPAAKPAEAASPALPRGTSIASGTKGTRPPGRAAPTPGAAAVAGAAGQVAPVPPANARYAVTAGTYPKADMARAERKHLSKLISYRVWITNEKVDGVKRYKLQFGTFKTREEAEFAAQLLVRRGLLREAEVALMPE